MRRKPTYKTEVIRTVMTSEEFHGRKAKEWNAFVQHLCDRFELKNMDYEVLTVSIRTTNKEQELFFKDYIAVEVRIKGRLK